MDNEAAWMMLFSGIISLNYHPGNKTPRTATECALLADVAYLQFLKRKDSQWPGSQAEPL